MVVWFLSRCCLWEEGEADMWISVPLSFSWPHQLTLSSLPRDYRPTQSSWSCLGNSEVRKSPYVQSSKVCKCFEEWEVVALPTTLHCLLCNFPSVYPSCSLLSESEGLSRGSSTRNSLFLGMFHSQMWTRKDLFQLWQRDLLHKENDFPRGALSKWLCVVCQNKECCRPTALELAMQTRTTLNSWFFCPHILWAGSKVSSYSCSLFILYLSCWGRRNSK